MSVRALLDHVLEEVAIDGEEGTPIPRLFEYVEEFYVKNTGERHDIAAVSTPAAAGGAAPADRPNLNEEFQEYIWDLLRQEADFNVGDANAGAHLALADIVADLKNAIQQDGEAAEPGNAKAAGHARWKVYASEERRWKALTGHGVDHKKLPNALFKLLEVIGKHRADGIIQPDLTKLSGQDKKSVPPRTTALKNMGYIDKISVLARSMNTSKLTLTKFAVRKNTPSFQAHAGKKGKGKQNEANQEWTGKTINTEKLVEEILNLLKAAKNHVLMHGDLKRKLGMDKSIFHWRNLSRILRRIEGYGVIKRIRVPLKINRRVKKGGSTVEVDVSEQCHARCVKFVREMTAADWRRLAAFSKNAVAAEDDDEAGSDEDDQNSKDDGVEVDPQAVKKLENVDMDGVEEVIRNCPQWNMNQPITNVIYDIVDATGTEGISSMDLMYRTVGSFYYRPMDQVLHRMTDFPANSQPAQFRNLAVIRETSISGRATHYHYFSYSNHQELVKAGLASEPWSVPDKGKKKGTKSNSLTVGSTSFRSEMEIDQYGFAAPNFERLLKKDGSASLSDSALEVMKTEKLNGIKRQFLVLEGKDGRKSIDWNCGYGRGGAGSKPQTSKAISTPQNPTPARKKRLDKRQAIIDKATLDYQQLQDALAEGRDEEVKAHPMLKRSLNEVLEEAAPTPRRGRPPKKQKTQAKKTPAKQTPTNPQTEAVKEKTPEVSPQVQAPFTTPTPGPRRRGLGKKTLAALAAKEAQEARAAKATQDTQVIDQGVTAVSQGEATPTAPSNEPAKPVSRRKGSGRKVTPAAPPTPSPIVPTETPTVVEDEETPSMALGEAPRKEAASQTAGPSEPVSNRKVQMKITDWTKGSSSLKRTSSPGVSTPQPQKQKRRKIKGTAQIVEPEPVTAVETEAESAVRQPSIPPEAPDVEVVDTGETQEEAASAVKAPTPPSLPPVPPPPPPPPLPAAVDVDGTTVEVEPVEAEENDNYGSIGGMLAIGRQQVVLELLSEHEGVFPSGIELRHAFNKRYQRKNPKAGMVVDRRLVRGVVQSLQYKGKINQLSFSFKNTRGLNVTKKIIAFSEIPLESEVVVNMTRKMIEADGNLWFPPGTELHPDIAERVRAPPVMSLPRAKAIQDVEFDRLDLPGSLRARQQQKEAKRVARLEKSEQKKQEQLKMSLFTAEQRAEAKTKRAQLKAESDIGKRIRNLERQLQRYLGLDNCAPSLPSFHWTTDWWKQLAERNGDAPQNADALLEDIDKVEAYEIYDTVLKADRVLLPGTDMLMINHFGPDPRAEPAPRVDMANCISARTDGISDMIPKHLRISDPWVEYEERGGSEEMAELDEPSNDFHGFLDSFGYSVRQAKDLQVSARPVQEPGPLDLAEIVRMFDKRRKPRRRAPGTKIMSRRDREMARLRRNKVIVHDDSVGLVEPVEPKIRHNRRIRPRVPKEVHQPILFAVIIFRTIFGSGGRVIDWSIIHKAFPDVEVQIIQSGWPRIRDAQKKNLKRFQVEFEEMYLEAYAAGKLPRVDVSDPASFDLAYHVKWFQENLKLPEADLVPELAVDHEAFEKLYNLTVEARHDWKIDYHNPALTMGNRANHFVCYAYETPLDGDDGNDPAPGVEYMESIIKANVITDESEYDPVHAYKLLSTQPEQLVNEAFWRLNVNKVVQHKKDKGRITPGRNYEFTDKFHHGLRSNTDAALFFHAIRQSERLESLLGKGQSVEIDPLSADGTIACIFDLLAHRRVRLAKHHFQSDIYGLSEGYQTRTINKEVFDFGMTLAATPGFKSKSGLAAPLRTPPIPLQRALPAPGGAALDDPIRIWCDINGNIVRGMWLTAVTAIMGLVLLRPGVDVAAITRAVAPSLSRREVRDVVAWLEQRGVVDHRGQGLLPTQGYYLFLRGLDQHYS